MNIDKREKGFLQRVKQELDAGVEQLDPVTLARLKSGRMRALEKAHQGGWRFTDIPRWVTAGGFATVTVAVVAVSLWSAAPRRNMVAAHPEDREIVASREQFDLYDDLEFYRWLAENGDAR